MNNEQKNLFYLHDLTSYKVASGYPDVRGWKVKDAEGNTVGKVEGLLVNKATERVVYLDVEIDEGIIGEEQRIYASAAKQGVHGFLNEEGENHLIIPIGLSDLDEEKEEVNCRKINGDTFRAAKRHKKDAPIERDYEMQVFAIYTGSEPEKGAMKADDRFYDREPFANRKPEM